MARSTRRTSAIVAIARHALGELGVARVRADARRHATAQARSRTTPGRSSRLEMCRLLLEGVAGVWPSARSSSSDDGPSYTVDSLRAIHASHPEAELTFIVGADIASTLAGVA